MSEIIIGIDPGLSGAIAWLEDGVILGVTDLPVQNGRIDSEKLADMILDFGHPSVVVIEKVSSMPGQGVASTFKFGQSYGSLLGVFGALKYDIVDVTPRRWKKDMNLSSDKEMCRLTAINRWPNIQDFLKRKKDHGRAEAALIAAWYYDGFCK